MVLSSSEEKRGATAIIAESQRPRLSFLVEASGWACHCDGRCPSAARALLISNHIDEKEFTTAIFSALFHGRGKQRNILSGDMFSLVRIRVKFEAISSFTICPCNVNKKHELRTALQHEADEQ